MEKRPYASNPEMTEILVTAEEQDEIKTCKKSGGILVNNCEEFSCYLNSVCNTGDKVKISLLLGGVNELEGLINKGLNKLERRLYNYFIEENSIEKKLFANCIPEEKKQKLYYRLGIVKNQIGVIVLKLYN